MVAIKFSLFSGIRKSTIQAHARINKKLSDSTLNDFIFAFFRKTGRNEILMELKYIHPNEKDITIW